MYSGTGGIVPEYGPIWPALQDMILHSGYNRRRTPTIGSGFALFFHFLIFFLPSRALFFFVFSLSILNFIMPVNVSDFQSFFNLFSIIF
jgi:hypothetical protein